MHEDSIKIQIKAVILKELFFPVYFSITHSPTALALASAPIECIALINVTPIRPALLFKQLTLTETSSGSHLE